MPNSQNNQFYPSDLDLKFNQLPWYSNLMYHHTKNEVFMSRHSKVIARTDGHDSVTVTPHYIILTNW